MRTHPEDHEHPVDWHLFGYLFAMGALAVIGVAAMLGAAIAIQAG